MEARKVKAGRPESWEARKLGSEKARRRGSWEARKLESEEAKVGEGRR